MEDLHLLVMLYYQLVMLPLWSPCIKYEALILRPR